MTMKGQVLGPNLCRAMHEGCGCWPSCRHLTMVPIVMSIPLCPSPVVIPICTHNPPYKQWLVGIGVGAVPFIIVREHGN